MNISLFTVLAGTFLGGMARPALEGLLTAGEALPFVGEVCKRAREFLFDNLLVRIHFIISMILVDRPCAMAV